MMVQFEEHLVSGVGFQERSEPSREVPRSKGKLFTQHWLKIRTRYHGKLWVLKAYIDSESG